MNIKQSFDEIVTGNEQDHVGLFMISPDGATCTIIHCVTKTDERSCAKDLLRVAINNFLSVFEGDDFDHNGAAREAEFFTETVIDEYKAEYVE